LPLPNPFELKGWAGQEGKSPADIHKSTGAFKLS
jgi:hypothetical protein